MRGYRRHRSILGRRRTRGDAMNVQRIPTQPIAGMKPGTCGLRKKVAEFQGRLPRELRAGDVRRGCPRRSAGRRWWWAATAATSTARRSRSSCAWPPRNGFGRVLVGQGGILSTPAASLRDPQARRLRRHRALGQPQPGRARRRLRHQVQHRQRRPGAGEASPKRSTRSTLTITELPHQRRRPTSTSTAPGHRRVGRHGRSR